MMNTFSAFAPWRHSGRQSAPGSSRRVHVSASTRTLRRRLFGYFSLFSFLLVVCGGSYSLGARGPGDPGAAGGLSPDTIAAPLGVSDAAASAPLLRATDLVYQGAFRLPHGPIGGSSFDYGGTALAFNPALGSLFMVGHAWQQQVAEVTIPAPAMGALSDLPTASVLQPFQDLSEGRMLSVGFDPVSDNPIVGGLLPYRNRLYEAFAVHDGRRRRCLALCLRDSI